jgi:hypothetical protein
MRVLAIVVLRDRRNVGSELRVIPPTIEELQGGVTNYGEGLDCFDEPFHFWVSTQRFGAVLDFGVIVHAPSVAHPY